MNVAPRHISGRSRVCFCFFTKIIFNWLLTVTEKKLTDSRKRYKILADNRKSHHPIETLVKGSWNPIPKLTIVLVWKTPACLKFGETSNRAVENLPQRKLWAAHDSREELIWYHRTSASAYFFGKDTSSPSRVRTWLITKSVYYEWASDSFAYPCPCNNSCLRSRVPTS